MKKMVLFFLFLFSCLTFSQFESPKSELRGVWVATVTNIDWPSNQGTTVSIIQNQKNQLINMFTAHKSYGLNTIFFQVRTICDALYKSNYEPWSSYLTGNQGTPPSDTSYDPLKFAIEQAHMRGMELHAWLNPYRAELQNGSPVSANHIINKHPDWIIKCNGSQYRFLDPGLPEVRRYVLRIVMDIVERYNVDGIHFDDYFYPYTDYGSFNDDSTFAKYSYGFTDRAAWRKNNVDLLLKMIDDSIKAVKPWVKFGVSPSGNPSVNSSIFINPADWLVGNYTDSTGTFHTGEPYIDYIMPQLYWERYNNNLGAWDKASFLNGRHLYVGQAAYRYNTFSPGELTWEILMNRGDPNVDGGVFFSSKSVTGNFGYCNDTLQYHYFTHPAITPKMDWKNDGSNKPNAPLNLRLEVNSTTGKYELHWDKPAPSANGDTAFSYVVYRSVDNPPDISNSSNLFGTTGETYLSSDYAKYSVTQGNNYVVTAIDRYSNESAISNVATLNLPSLIPGNVSLQSPIDESNDISMSTTLKWTGDSNTVSYVVEVSTDSTFNSGMKLLMGEYKSSQVEYSSIVPGETYYWRVKAFGQVGASDYSAVYNFKSGIPVSPVLDLPAHATTDVSLTPVFSWYPADGATKYRIQVSTTVQFYSGTYVIDTTITDTTFSSPIALDPLKIYYWRGNAQNSYGTSFWSGGFGFKTGTATGVAIEGAPVTFGLNQNYPNPFNPSTTIRYEIPKSGFVILKIYDELGREVKTLINQYQSRGSHEIIFNASQLASGVYFYQLKAGSSISTKKMILLK